ncbi:hypothetical protein CC117_30990 [Parafrankia colletiae]|uniref:Uncharacterized protein n=1 Tax=Parafrankia colletiae TaxID=573497 RepID=A0A1S1Q2E5_9ACTN|nr:hypothetical protein CC117_30990 [Parafrankia colletiae]
MLSGGFDQTIGNEFTVQAATSPGGTIVDAATVDAAVYDREPGRSGYSMMVSVGSGSDGNYRACVHPERSGFTCTDDRSFALKGQVVASIGLSVLADPGPGNAIGGGTIIDALPDGTEVTFACYRRDVPIPGPYGTSDTWVRIESYDPPGDPTPDTGEQINPGSIDRSGFVSDSFLYTGADTATFAPPCD